jgi:hypothetical protein
MSREPPEVTENEVELTTFKQFQIGDRVVPTNRFIVFGRRVAIDQEAGTITRIVMDSRDREVSILVQFPNENAWSSPESLEPAP